VISLYTTLGLWIGAILFGHPARTASLRFSGWTAVIVSGITAIALGHVCFYTAIKRIGATLPSLVILAQPFVVFSISSVVFGERLTLSQLAFGVLLLAGAGLSVWAQEDLRTAPQGPAAQDR